MLSGERCKKMEFGGREDMNINEYTALMIT